MTRDLGVLADKTLVIDPSAHDYKALFSGLDKLAAAPLGFAVTVDERSAAITAGTTRVVMAVALGDIIDPKLLSLANTALALAGRGERICQLDDADDWTLLVLEPVELAALRRRGTRVTAFEQLPVCEKAGVHEAQRFATPLDEPGVVERLARRLGDPARARELVTTWLAATVSALAHARRADLPGFGELVAVRRDARLLRDPRSGEMVGQPSQWLVRWTPVAELSAWFNGRCDAPPADPVAVAIATALRTLHDAVVLPPLGTFLRASYPAGQMIVFESDPSLDLPAIPVDDRRE
jgi:nucleoid DNA-binding protein